MGVGGVASGSGPGAFPSEIMKKIRSQANRGRRRNFEKCLRHRRAGPSHPVRSACEHSNPQRTKASAARAVAETQNEGASQEGATPKPGAVRGTQWAALRTLAFRVGRRVRISFAPAASQVRTCRWLSRPRKTKWQPRKFIQTMSSHGLRSIRQRNRTTRTAAAGADYPRHAPVAAAA
jgi:hypothetical protein